MKTPQGNQDNIKAKKKKNEKERKEGNVLCINQGFMLLFFFFNAGKCTTVPLTPRGLRLPGRVGEAETQGPPGPG